jgi:nicotinate-nucleotide adenylyltransferase
MSESAQGRRVAFFGGSFDPPHYGHLAVARAAREALELDTVLFAPVGAQPLKPSGSTASFADRVAMTRLAIGSEAELEVSLADAPRPSGEPNFTFDTLLALRNQVPQPGVLFCLMGADAFLGLHAWHRAAEIPFLAPLVVASRPGQRLEGMCSSLPQGLRLVPLPQDAQADFQSGPGRHAHGLEACLLENQAGQTTPFFILPNLEVEISASMVREAIHGQGDARPSHAPQAGDLLPHAVLDYIRSHGLYR